MRLLYVAAGIAVPGSYGGSTHTLEVARGLAALGHEVHVVARPPADPAAARAALGSVRLHASALPKPLTLLAYPELRRLIRTLRPDAVLERYYNLAGAGVLAAARANIPVLLEVNALMIDPPAVAKRRWDDRLGRPLARWATQQCRLAARIVTPLHTTVPAAVDRRKIVELPWGANVEAFQPAADPAASAALRARLGIPAARPVVAFLGSFRAWHGVADFVAAAVQLLRAGADYHFLLIGDGPERAAAQESAASYAAHFSFVGSLDHTAVPAHLALAAVGVAPFNTAPHPALRAAGFFWSPLKIYEYMAMGLPVVTANIPPLDQTIREGQEGALFREGDVADLAAAIRRVVADPARAALGQRARDRVVALYSWQAHCRALDEILTEMTGAGRG